MKGASTTSRCPARTRSCTCTKRCSAGRAGASPRSGPVGAITRRRPSSDRPPPTPTRTRTPMPLVTHFDAHAGHAAPAALRPDYRFRAGPSISPATRVREDAIDPQHVTPSTRFRRWDRCRRRGRPAPASSPKASRLMRMVIRSTLGVAAGRVRAARPHHDARRHTPTRSRTATRTSATSRRRWLAAARGVARRVRRGDRASRRGSADSERAVRRRRRESGSFLAAGPGVFVVNPADPDAATVLTPGRDEGATPLQSGRVRAATTSTSSTLPYLPDPLSVGASFTSLPGAPARGCSSGSRPPRTRRGTTGVRCASGSRTARARRCTTPNRAAAHRLAAAGRDGDRAAVVVPRPEGTQELFGPWMIRARHLPFAAAAAAPSAGPAVDAHAVEPLTLVHAVEKPLAPPVIKVPAAGVPNTGVQRLRRRDVRGAVGVDRRTTRRARAGSTSRRCWSEPVDDVLAGRADTLAGNAHVGDFQLERVGGRRVGSAATTRRASGRSRRSTSCGTSSSDTKHRNVTYQATATTRFREYFPPAITNDRDADHAHRSARPAQHPVLAPARPAGRALRRADVDVRGADRPRARRPERDSNACRRRFSARAPAAVCAST